jgi:hypothetical protein
MSTGLFDNDYSNVVINVADGVTVTINMDLNLSNTTINGGTLIVNKKLNFKTASTLTNVNIKFTGNASMTNSSTLNVKNSQLIFKDNSTYSLANTVTLDNSRIFLMGSSSISAFTGKIDLKNLSFIQIGDGAISSDASMQLFAVEINEYDNSYISIANNNNYYSNLSSYNTKINNKSYSTLLSPINCNKPGKNACSFSNVYGPATLNYGGVSSSAILPVKLTAFGVKADASFVDITWATAAEVNAKSFVIERSYDGQNWSSIGVVKANGNTAQASSYSYKDFLKVGGKVQYRLKMVDQDETFSYSPVRTVNAEGLVEMNIYPNPATTYVMINTKNGAADQLTIQLFNQAGQVVKQVNGNGNTVVSVSDLNMGNYFVRVATKNGTSQTFKLLIKK